MYVSAQHDLVSLCFKEFGMRVSCLLSQSKRPQPNLSFSERQALRSLKEDNSITIRKADKGNAFVILNSEDYSSKMFFLLQNPTFFKRLDSDPTLSQEKALNAFLKSLLDKDFLEKPLYRFLRSSNARTPQAYGLPKIHKDGTPLRPIISAVRAFNFNVGKLLVWILAPYSDKSDSFVKNSAQLVQKLSQTNPGQSAQVSFDVSSLFTNVPVAETVDLALDLIRADDDSRNWFPLGKLKELFHFAASKCNFQFEGVNFDQIDGLAMGNPLAPPLANIFMVNFEKRALDRLRLRQNNISFTPLDWLRYVDDVYCRLRRSEKKKVPEILVYLNSQHPNITFIVETEKEGSLAFLEVSISAVGRQNGKYVTSVYRKPTHTNLYIRWESSHPPSQKLGVLKTLLHRARLVCNNDESFKAEVQHLRQNFEELGFPKSRVNAILDAPPPVPAPSSQDKPKQTPLVVPFIPGFSQKLGRIWRDLTTSYNLNVPSTVVFRPMGNLKSSLCSLYPPEPEGRGVYRATCAKKDCKNQSCYIGETSLTLDARKKTHFQDKKSALREHYLNVHPKDPAPDFSFELLRRDVKTSTRRIREALKIRSENPPLNRDKGVKPYVFV